MAFHKFSIRKGFTLIEILAALTIIAVLIGIGLAGYDKAQQNARDSRRKRDLFALKGALVSYYQDKGYYPPCTAPPCTGLGVDYFASDSADPWITGLIDPPNPYIKKLPKDPKQAGILTQLAQLIFGRPDGESPKFAIAGVSDMTASYDSTRKVPVCTVAASSCDTGSLLVNSRDNISGGAEPNPPNTINNSCADGTSGGYHIYESIDQIKVSTQDGAIFAPNATVRIDVKVWVFSLTLDKLDLYYASDANSPTWTLIATITPSGVGAQNLSANYTLPAGNLQAVRGQFRYDGTLTSSCTTGFVTDHDDLIFAVSSTSSPSPTPSASPSPSPTPSPTPSPSSSPLPANNCNLKQVYCYAAAKTRDSFVLWAQLDNKNDTEIANKPNASCSRIDPPSLNFNYCLESPQ